MRDELHLDCLNGPDVAALALTDDEFLAAVEAGLVAQGRGGTVIEPRMHLVPGPAFNGRFNALRAFVGPLGLAGVKVVSDYADNHALTDITIKVVVDNVRGSHLESFV
jgi:alanine dehydrogenase